jgi:hypothetical protein
MDALSRTTIVVLAVLASFEAAGAAGFIFYQVSVLDDLICTGLSVTTDVVMKHEFTEQPYASDWGETTNGLRCRIVSCQVSGDQELDGAIDLGIRAEIENKSEETKRICLYSRGISKDPEHPALALPPSFGIKYDAGETWQPVGDSLSLKQTPSEIVIPPKESRFIEFSERILRQRLDHILQGATLKLEISGHKIASSYWGGPMSTGQFVLKSRAEKKIKEERE